MAVNNARTKSRIKVLAMSGKTTDIVLADFRSAEEIKEYLRNVNAFVNAFSKRFQKLRDLYTRFSRKLIAKSKQQANTMDALNIDTDMSDRDLLERMRQRDKLEKPKTKSEKTSNIRKIALKIPASDMNKLAKESADVAKIYEHIENLQTILALIDGGGLTKSKNVSYTAIQRETNATLKKAKAEAKKAETFLNKHATATAPETFTKIIEKIVNGVLKKYEKGYHKKQESLHISAVETKGEKGLRHDVKYVHYLLLKEMITENGNTEDIYLVFCGVVNTEKSTLAMYVNYLNRFVPPSKVDLGADLFVNENDGLDKAINLITLNQFSTELEVQPLPESPSTIKSILNSQAWIKDVERISISREKIFVYLKQKSANKQDKNWRRDYEVLKAQKTAKEMELDDLHDHIKMMKEKDKPPKAKIEQITKLIKNLEKEIKDLGIQIDIQSKGAAKSKNLSIMSDKRKKDLEAMIKNDLLKLVQMYYAKSEKMRGARPRLYSKIENSPKGERIRFWLTTPAPDARKERLDDYLVEQLRKVFPFSDAQLRQIIKIANY